MDLAQFDWMLYWFMFPVAVCVATTATLSGIGGAAIFTPIFMIIFPLLGPEYPLPSIAASIGVVLLTATFGSSSGFLGYFRKRLVDFKSAVPFILVGAPVGVFGAVLLTSIKEYEEALRGAYALLMFVLVYVLIRRHSPAEGAPADVMPAPQIREIIARDGTAYSYAVPRHGIGAITTGLGGFLTGLLGVGIGEVVMPQLVKRNRLPFPVAVATSVFVVIAVFAAASVTQISLLVAGGGLAAVPWNVVIYTVPGVIIGGQIGPRLQGKVSPRAMENAIGSLFAMIGIAMSYIAIRNSFFS